MIHSSVSQRFVRFTDKGRKAYRLEERIYDGNEVTMPKRTSARPTRSLAYSPTKPSKLRRSMRQMERISFDTISISRRPAIYWWDIG